MTMASSTVNTPPPPKLSRNQRRRKAGKQEKIVVPTESAPAPPVPTLPTPPPAPVAPQAVAAPVHKPAAPTQASIEANSAAAGVEKKKRREKKKPPETKAASAEEPAAPQTPPLEKHVGLKEAIPKTYPTINKDGTERDAPAKNELRAIKKLLEEIAPKSLEGFEKKKEKAIVVPQETMRVKFSLSARNLKVLETTFPGYKFETEPGAIPHTHPLLSIERRIAEKRVYNSLIADGCKIIVDIGGNALRHAQRPEVWSCNPVLTPSDVCRVKSIEACPTMVRKCSHKVEICPCQPDPDAYMSIHSLYYLHPDLVCELVNHPRCKRLVAVHHVFPDPKGSFGDGEAWYVKRPDGVVVTETYPRGATAYIHGDLSWLSAGFHVCSGTRGASLGRRMAMAWTVVEVVGSSHVTAFYVAPTTLAPDTPVSDAVMLPLAMALNSSDNRGEVDIRGVLAKDELVRTSFGVKDIALVRMFNFEKLFAYYAPSTPNTPITIPKGAVAAVAVHISGRARDPTTFQLANAYAKKVLKCYNLPEEEVAALIPYVTALGFTVGLEDEHRAYVAALGPHYEMIKQHNKVLSFELPFLVKEWHIMAGTIGLFGLLGLAWTVKRRGLGALPADPRVMQLNMFETLKGLIPPWLSSRVSRLVSRVIPPWLSSCFMQMHMLGVVSFLRSWRPPQSVGVVHHCPVIFEDVCNEGRPVRQLAEDAKVQVDDDAEECFPRPATIQLGPVSPYRAPLVSRSCYHNEYLGVRNRCVMPLEDEDLDVWKMVEAKGYEVIHARFAEKGLLDKNGRLPPVPFEEWVRRFPGHVRPKFRQARLDLIADGLSEDDCRVQAFSKREHVLKAFPEGDESFDSRLIQGRRPKYQVATGPWTLAFSNALKKAWTYNPLKKKNIVYAPGHTANQLGAMIDDFIDRHREENIVFIEDDASRYDGTLGEGAIGTEQRWFRVIAPRDVRKALRKQKKTKASTRRRVRFVYKWRRKSGDGNTSGGNGALNGTSHATMLDSPLYGFSYVVVDYLIEDSGDDIIIVLVVDEVETLRDCKIQVKDFFSSLGLVMKTHVYDCRYDMEFCSGRFWPSTKGTILGPKIGRVMSKLFHSINIYTPDHGVVWARGVALGLQLDVNHIPILRVLVRKVLQLTEGLVPVVQQKYRSSKEKHKIHASEAGEVCPKTWEMMDHLYGVTESQVIEVETLMEQQIKQLVCTILHPVLDLICEIDIPPPELENFPRQSALCSIVAQMSSFEALVRQASDRTLTEEEEDMAKVVLFVTSVVVAPPLEEGFKRINPACEYLFISLETIGKLMMLRDQYKVNPDLAVLSFPFVVFGVFAHHYVTKLPYVKAVKIHAAWNFCALLATGGPTALKRVVQKQVAKERSTPTVMPVLKELIHSGLVFANKVWNRLMHAINGNIEHAVDCSDDRETLQFKVAPTVLATFRQAGTDRNLANVNAHRDNTIYVKGTGDVHFPYYFPHYHAWADKVYRETEQMQDLAEVGSTTQFCFSNHDAVQHAFQVGRDALAVATKKRTWFTYRRAVEQINVQEHNIKAFDVEAQWMDLKPPLLPGTIYKGKGFLGKRKRDTLKENPFRAAKRPRDHDDFKIGDWEVSLLKMPGWEDDKLRLAVYSRGDQFVAKVLKRWQNPREDDWASMAAYFLGEP